MQTTGAALLVVKIRQLTELSHYSPRYAGKGSSQSSQKRDGDPLRQQGAAITSRPSL